MKRSEEKRTNNFYLGRKTLLLLMTAECIDPADIFWVLPWPWLLQFVLNADEVGGLGRGRVTKWRDEELIYEC